MALFICGRTKFSLARVGIAYVSASFGRTFTAGGQKMSRAVAILVARLIFAGMFAMAAAFKFSGMADTASYIAAAGFPMPLLLAWLAAFFEVALVLAFLTGAFFSEAALL